MNYTKYSGYFLIGTGVIHSIIGVLLGWPTLVSMHESGWLASTIVNGEMAFNREAILWFLTLGAFWIVFGLCLQKMIDQGFIPPKSLGWGFIVIAAVLIIIVPVSGAYFFLIQGTLILMPSKNEDLGAAETMT